VEYAEGIDGMHVYQVINDHGDGWDELLSDEKGTMII
jgi:alpha-amylase